MSPFSNRGSPEGWNGLPKVTWLVSGREDVSVPRTCSHSIKAISTQLMSFYSCRIEQVACAFTFSFLEKLAYILSSDSLMAEVAWLIFIFPFPASYHHPKSRSSATLCAFLRYCHPFTPHFPSKHALEGSSWCSLPPPCIFHVPDMPPPSGYWSRVDGTAVGPNASMPSRIGRRAWSLS